MAQLQSQAQNTLIRHAETQISVLPYNKGFEQVGSTMKPGNTLLMSLKACITLNTSPLRIFDTYLVYKNNSDSRILLTFS